MEGRLGVRLGFDSHNYSLKMSNVLEFVRWKIFNEGEFIPSTIEIIINL